MKRLSILLTMVIAIGFSAIAQQRNVNPASFKTLEKTKMKKRNYTPMRDDTLFVFFHDQPCDSIFYVYLAPGADGFLSGHNSYIDSAKAEQWTGGESGDSIIGMLLWFGDATFTSTTQKVHAKLWDATGAGGSPGAELASVDITHSQIASDIDSGFLTVAEFPTPVLMPANGNYFVGFKMDYKKVQGQLTFDANRAVALVNSSISDPDNDTVVNECSDDAIENTAWELWSKTAGGDGQWHSYFDVYGVATRNQIYPLVLHPSTCAVIISPTSSTICKGTTVALTASGGSTYTWAPSTGLNVTTGATVNAKPTATTTYTVTANGGACTATITMTVNKKPVAKFTQGACTGGHVLLTRTGTPASGVTFKWFKNGVGISGATNSTYSATTTGNYKVKVVITATGCAKTSPEQTVTINCKTAQSEMTSFTADAYPNPFTKSLNVNISSPSRDVATVQIMDFSGRTLNTFNNVDASIPFEINEDLTPGVYFIKVVQGLNDKMIKVVKSE